MKQYFATTRGPWHSFLFALPLVALYQAMVFVANLGHRSAVINGADAMVQNAVSLLGVHGWLGSTLLVTAVAGIVAYRLDAAGRKGRPQLSLFFGVLAESAVYALLFGSLVSLLTSLVLPGGGVLRMGGGLSFGQKLESGLGAGIYEELVFRVVLMGLMLVALRKLKVSSGSAAVISVLASSLLFSLMHYVGPYADPPQLTSFTFRLISGIVLAALFAARGYAVAAWTHALYDVFLLFARGG